MASESAALANVDELASKIENVERDIELVKAALERGGEYLGSTDQAWIRSELAQLREERRQLHEKELLLLRRQPPPTSSELKAAVADFTELKAAVASQKAAVASLEAANASLKRRVDELSSEQEFSISALKQGTKFNSFMLGLGCELVVYTQDETAITAAGELPDFFEWIDQEGQKKPEDAGASIVEYIAHLELLVPLSHLRDLAWYDCTKRRSFLSVKASHGLPFGVNGTADAAICLQSAINCQVPQTGLRVIFEVKVDGAVDDGAVRQTAVQVCLANIHSRRLRPIGVLTDLRERWIIIWIHERTVRTWYLSRGVAIAILRRIVREEEVQQNGYIKRTGEERKDDPLNYLWTRETTVEQDHRARVDSTDGAAARLEELNDFPGLVSPEEVEQMRRLDVERMVSAIPCFAALDATAPPWGMYG